MNCSLCDLSKYRKNIVMGVGPKDCDFMFIGEAPGRDEDEQGKPFVGRAGRLLDASLESVGIKREKVYITNAVKCRPPNNRRPVLNEINACRPILEKEIADVESKVIVLLGQTARIAFDVMNLKMISHTRSLQLSEFLTYRLPDRTIGIFVTYHPMAQVYNPNLKKLIQEDFDYLRQVKEKVLQ